jgi:trehalose synthase
VREGFGLVVSETLWKGTPMVAGRAGGIPMQMSDGAGGFLVGSVEECAEKLVYLLEHPAQSAEMALQGRELVRERFLLPRLLCDELELCAELLGVGAASS